MNAEKLDKLSCDDTDADNDPLADTSKNATLPAELYCTDLPDLLADKVKAAFDLFPFAGTEVGQRVTAEGT